MALSAGEQRHTLSPDAPLVPSLSSQAQRLLAIFLRLTNVHFIAIEGAPLSDSWVCTNTHYCSKCQIALCRSSDEGPWSQHPLRRTTIVIVHLRLLI